MAELERLVHLISHDLRTPLTTLSGFAELARSALGDRSPQVGEYLDRVVANAHLLSDQLDGVLTLSRILQGREPDTELDLTEVAREERELADGRIDLCTPPGDDRWVRAPREMVRRVAGHMVDRLHAPWQPPRDRHARGGWMPGAVRLPTRTGRGGRAGEGG